MLPRSVILLVAMLTASQIVDRAWGRGLRPPPRLMVSEWADTFRYVAAPSPEPGEWRTSRTPYLRQPMDCLSPTSPTRYITFMKGSQVGATELGLNWTGYTIDQKPTSMIIMLPSQGVAEEWSKVRLAQLVDNTPVIRGKILDVTRRDSGNTTYSKKVAGGLGFLKIAWSSSASKLRSTPAENLLSDEVDGFEEDVEGEGDPIALLERRFTNFPRGKSLRISTPTKSPGSRIYREFAQGDQRYYFLPCPECGHFQRLTFDRLRWPHRPESSERPEERESRCTQVHFCCVACEAQIPERMKTRMLAEGMWVATVDRPELVDLGFGAPKAVQDILERMEGARHASFHLSALYSPLGWYSWAQVAEDWEKAQSDPRLLKVFVMTILGEVWIDRGEAPDSKRLYERREEYEIGVVPGGYFLTAGVDVQKDRLEYEVVAWGFGKESWSVEYGAIPGDTSGQEVWQQLDALLSRDWPTVSGQHLPIQVMGIDTGYRPQPVYQFVRRHAQAVHSVAGSRTAAPRTVIPTKGGSDPYKLISHVSSADAARRRKGVKIVEIGTPVAKQEFYDWLRLPAPTAPGESYPPGYCHLPGYDYGYFQGITAETRIVRGSGKVEWVVDPGIRNEPLDCRVIARAAASIFGLDRFEERHWVQLGWNPSKIAVKPPDSRQTAEEEAPIGQISRVRRRRFHGFQMV